MQKSGLAHLCHPTRLKWFKVIPDELIPGKDSPEWIAFVKASEAYVKARIAYVKAGEAYFKASEVYNKVSIAYVTARKTRVVREALQRARKAYVSEACDGEAYDKAWKACIKAERAYLTKYSKELDILHEQLFPGCPWDGNTMFPEKEK